VWFALAFLTAATAILVLSVRDCRAQQRCEELGGHVETYDCRTSYMTSSCGSDCETTVPVTTCEWRCVDAPAEQPRP
jgi:hypothetical protein